MASPNVMASAPNAVSSAAARLAARATLRRAPVTGPDTMATAASVSSAGSRGVQAAASGADSRPSGGARAAGGRWSHGPCPSRGQGRPVTSNPTAATRTRARRGGTRQRSRTLDASASRAVACEPMAPAFYVTGGRPLEGTIRPAGNKNAALPILAATLLADGPCTIDNVPEIGDVETMLALLAHLGAGVRRSGDHAVEVDPRSAELRALDPALCARIRASILLAGPMVARFGRVSLPPPGGDVIGRRRVDTHFLALERMGAEVTVGDAYKLEAPRGLTGADIFLDEPSVTATENALMAAAAARGTTVLRNAASEPHVQDLARFLVALGAEVDGIGTNTLTVRGKTPLGAAGHTLGPDHIEIGSFIGLAAVTDGAITIDGVRADDLRATPVAFDRLGIRPRVDGARLVVDAPP